MLLVLFPLFATLTVAIPGPVGAAPRAALAWPASSGCRLLALALLTGDVAAGSSGHLWVGITGGGFLGMAVLVLVGAAVQGRAIPPTLGTPASWGGSGTARSGSAAGPAGRAGSPGGRTRDRRPPIARPPAHRGPTPTLVARTPPVPQPTGPPLPAAAGVVGAPGSGWSAGWGSGGFGRVWLAQDARLGHQVALKAAHAPDAETEQRIQREARALATIRHPNCVRIYDLLPAATDPGLAELDGLVIVMEYVDGEPLGELVRGHGVLDDIAAARVWSVGRRARWTPRTGTG